MRSVSFHPVDEQDSSEVPEVDRSRLAEKDAFIMEWSLQLVKWTKSLDLHCSNVGVFFDNLPRPKLDIEQIRSIINDECLDPIGAVRLFG